MDSSHRTAIEDGRRLDSAPVESPGRQSNEVATPHPETPRTANTAAVRGFISELDQLVSKVGASIDVKYNESKSFEILGNQSGYLRLGIELMKFGLTTTSQEANGAVTGPDLRYVIDPKSATGIGPLLRVPEDFAAADLEQAKFEKAFRRVLIAVLIGMGLLAAVGMVGVAIWFTS